MSKTLTTIGILIGLVALVISIYTLVVKDRYWRKALIADAKNNSRYAIRLNLAIKKVKNNLTDPYNSKPCDQKLEEFIWQLDNIYNLSLDVQSSAQELVFIIPGYKPEKKTSQE